MQEFGIVETLFLIVFMIKTKFYMPDVTFSFYVSMWLDEILSCPLQRRISVIGGRGSPPKQKSLKTLF